LIGRADLRLRRRRARANNQDGKNEGTSLKHHSDISNKLARR
jgi:hypothetical protein